MVSITHPLLSGGTCVAGVMDSIVIERMVAAVVQCATSCAMENGRAELTDDDYIAGVMMVRALEKRYGLFWMEEGQGAAFCDP